MPKRVLVLFGLLTVVACGSPLQPVSPPTTQATASASTSSPVSSQDVCHPSGVTYCVLNPAVTQATIRQTICVSGWTKTIRPPVTYTDNLKRQQMQAEGLGASTGSYEEDHRMPLELGGAPRDPMNLSPEFGTSPNAKDRDEDADRQAVCSGRLTLAAAQQQILSWLGPWPQYRR